MKSLLSFALQISLTIAISLSCLPTAKSQCTFLKFSEITRLARFSFQNKLKQMRARNAKMISVKENQEKCDYRTFASCKNYISDTQWHWAEIITFNSCDKVLSYSTSEQVHFNQLKLDIAKSYEPLSTRRYNDLEFQMYQNEKGQVIEINQHPNEEGKMFYLLNVIIASPK